MNNWGHSLMVLLKTRKNSKGERDKLKETEQAIRTAVCEKSVDEPTEGFTAESGCVHWRISKVWYDIVRRMSGLRGILRINTSRRGRMGSGR